MIPLVTEKLRVSVLCIWPKPITRSPDSPHREFRNFLVFLEFGVIATCALADSLTSETWVLMWSDFSNPQGISPPFQRPQKVSYLFLRPDIFRLKINFHTKMQGCIAICRAPSSWRVQELWLPLFEINSGKERSITILSKRQFGTKKLRRILSSTWQKGRPSHMIAQTEIKIKYNFITKVTTCWC